VPPAKEEHSEHFALLAHVHAEQEWNLHTSGSLPDELAKREAFMHVVIRADTLERSVAQAFLPYRKPVALIDGPLPSGEYQLHIVRVGPGRQPCTWLFHLENAAFVEDGKTIGSSIEVFAKGGEPSR
jgi:hypothetical protein